MEIGPVEDGGQLADPETPPLVDLRRWRVVVPGDHGRGAGIDVDGRGEPLGEAGEHLVEAMGRTSDRHLVGLGEVEHHVANLPARTPGSRTLPVAVGHPSRRLASSAC